MLNMLFASLSKQMLDSIIRLAVNNPRMGIGRVIPIPLSPVPQTLPWERVRHICLLVHRIPNIFLILQHFHNGLSGRVPSLGGLCALLFAENRSNGSSAG